MEARNGIGCCGRLASGQPLRLHETAAVGNRRAGCQPAASLPHLRAGLTGLDKGGWRL